MASIPIDILLLDFFAVFFVVVDADDFLEVFVIVFLTVRLLSSLLLLIVVVVSFASLPLVLSWLLFGDSQREGRGVRIISNNKVKKYHFFYLDPLCRCH
jgi:hypothetical protein